MAGLQAESTFFLYLIPLRIECLNEKKIVILQEIFEVSPLSNGFPVADPSLVLSQNERQFFFELDSSKDNVKRRGREEKTVEMTINNGGVWPKCWP